MVCDMHQKIKNQVKLPIRVAFGVVLQGIRIRFGRSLVTLSGVALGVAFLMSIFTGQVIKHGVRHEEAIRNEIGRMYGFLTVEIGPSAGGTVDILQVGPLGELELRLVEKLRDERVGVIRWATVPGATASSDVGPVQSIEPAALGGEGSIGVVVMGDPAALSGAWSEVLVPPVVAAPVAVARRALLPPPTATQVPCLQRELRDDEIADAADQKRQQQFRSGWIITISLLVTVMGIANAMLMSVTERFREIGTMKCLGALSSFIRRIFLIESSLIGITGALTGAAFGVMFSICAYGLTYGFGMVLGSMAWLGLVWRFGGSVAIGLLLAVTAAIYPATFASRMVPADALRSNI